MKTTTAFIVLVVVLVAGYFAIRIAENTDRTDTTDNTEEERVRGPEEIALSVGDTKDAAGLSVTFNAVSEDSRCPVDVQCVWAGRAVIELSVKSGEEKTALQLATDGDTVEFAGYAISLVSISPETHSAVEIAQTEYVVTIRVAPTAVGDAI